MVRVPALLLAGAVLLAATVSTRASSVPARAFVVAPGEGEVLDGPNGEVRIKVDPGTGSTLLAMGTQHVLVGKGIAVHQHEHADEILFIHRGHGFGIVGEGRTRLESGSTVYIPRGVWHGVENPEGAVDLVWVVSPPGLESFFRETRTPRGSAPRSFTRQEMDDLRRKHGMKVKPPG